MSVNKKHKLIGNIVLGIITTLTVVLIVLSLHLYLEDVEAKSREILQKTEMDYTIEERELNSEGLYVVDLKSILTDVVNEYKVSSITCTFPDESFSLDFKVNKNEDDMSFEINKVVDDEYGVSTRMNFSDVESIEYRTGNPQKSTIIKINTKDGHEYFAMSHNINYFLGQDIENVSFMNDRFYYLSYNPKYKELRNVTVCDKKLKSSIEDFKNSDYYYKYGKINFLDDFYQKLSSKVYTVENRCDDLNDNIETEATKEA